MGASMILPVQEGETDLTSRANLASGESLLELAVKQNSDPWTLASVNSLGGTWDVLSDDTFYTLAGSNNENANGLPAAFQGISVSPLPLVQGATEVIKVQTQAGATVSGSSCRQTPAFFSGWKRPGCITGNPCLVGAGHISITDRNNPSRWKQTIFRANGIGYFRKLSKGNAGGFHRVD